MVATAVGFRNRLVHRDAEIDDERAVGNLDRVDDIAADVSELAGLPDS